MQIARFVRARVAVIALIGLGLALFTVPVAQAYPTTVCSVSVTPKHLVGGKTITATGTANEAIDWTFVLEASSGGSTVATQRATGHGKTFTHVFHTPKVAKATNLVLRSSCGGDTGAVIDPASTGKGGVGGNGNGGNNGGPSSGGGGVLPNTGGPALWLALLGVALIGGGAYTIRRQRKSAASKA
jgi:LPXTG-motif cell wall-anchored protein